jgi:hypothetical protein
LTFQLVRRCTLKVFCCCSAAQLLLLLPLLQLPRLCLLPAVVLL